MLGFPADWADQTALQTLAGNGRWPGMKPLASVYSGRQFGVWAGQLGDGRALWLGEPVSVNLMGGVALVAAGIALVNRQPP